MQRDGKLKKFYSANSRFTGSPYKRNLLAKVKKKLYERRRKLFIAHFVNNTLANNRFIFYILYAGCSIVPSILRVQPNCCTKSSL